MSVRSIEIPRYGGPEVFRLVEKSSSPISSDSVRIRVSAAGVNFADLMMRMGSYPEAPKRPFVPGYEVAGVLTEVGQKVRRFQIGDRVLAATRFGGYTTELVLPEDQVWKTPPSLSDEEAVAIPVNFMAAWIALEDMARVRAGDRVLIPSAAGGVGIAALQIALKAGAEVTGMIGNPGKAELIRSLGAHPISYEDADAFEGKFDIVLDATGGKSLKRSFRALAPAGRIVHYGVSGIVGGNRRSLGRTAKQLVQTPFFHPLQLMMESKGIFGLNLLQLFAPEKKFILTKAMNQILARFERNELRVVIGKTFPLEAASAAHSYLQSRRAVGKVVLLCQT